MAASTVAYTDTTGNMDYLGMIAGQIGRRLKEASNMASEERAYAEEQAEAGGTSLSEAGIGRGYFLREPLVQDLAEIELPEPRAEWVWWCWN